MGIKFHVQSAVCVCVPQFCTVRTVPHITVFPSHTVNRTAIIPRFPVLILSSYHFVLQKLQTVNRASFFTAIFDDRGISTVVEKCTTTTALDLRVPPCLHATV